MSKKLTFQEIILTLQQFWNDQGCMLMQAYDNEKGAGTMSPYTFLRAGVEAMDTPRHAVCRAVCHLDCRHAALGDAVGGTAQP